MSGGIAPSVRHVTVGAEHAGQRIDNFLMRTVSGVPRALVYKVLRRGEVRVNKGRVKQSYRVEEGDVVRIPPIRQADPAEPPAPGAGMAEALERAILFESERWIVLNKPAGLAVHGGSGLRLGVIEAMRKLRPRLAYLELAHRLDRDTSGCLLLATRASALRAAHAALREREARKDYLAMVAGRWPQRRMRVDLPLTRNVRRSGERVVTVDEHDGKPARTDFELLQASDRFSLVRAHPITGRTHQIRVHALAAGHAIAGDTRYADKALNAKVSRSGLKRLFLHAERLRIAALDLDVYAPPEVALVNAAAHFGLQLPVMSTSGNSE